jgi:A/G-specific adenine glycosylase
VVTSRRSEGFHSKYGRVQRSRVRPDEVAAVVAKQQFSRERLQMPESRTLTIQRALTSWFRRHQRDLPWRRTRNAYRIWVSEVMLQQTQVDTVIPYYDRFIRQFPTIKTLATADLETVLKAWEGLGYYGRARNLLEAAQIVVRDYRGRIPRDIQMFRELPGVGAYIGAAVMSIAFDQPYAVVDGNVKRVLSRLDTISKPINSSMSQKIFANRAQALLDSKSPGLFNQALMELGALQCTPRKPSCNTCPLRRQCNAYQKGAVERFPKKTPRRSIPTYSIAVGVVVHDGRVLITRRKLDGLLGGLWEFPGGKVRKDEDARSACEREIREETGVSVAVKYRLATVKHAYTHFKVVMDVFTCSYQTGVVHLAGPIDYRWVFITELDRFPFPKANKKFMSLLFESGFLANHGEVSN